MFHALWDEHALGGSQKREERIVSALSCGLAGIIRDNMIWKMSVEDFDAVININLKGTWLMCREAAKVMKEQKKGKIVNIASRAWLGNRG